MCQTKGRCAKFSKMWAPREKLFSAVTTQEVIFKRSAPFWGPTLFFSNTALLKGPPPWFPLGGVPPFGRARNKRRVSLWARVCPLGRSKFPPWFSPRGEEKGLLGLGVPLWAIGPFGPIWKGPKIPGGFPKKKGPGCIFIIWKKKGPPGGGPPGAGGPRGVYTPGGSFFFFGAPIFYYSAEMGGGPFITAALLLK